jgi:hypothetical protein
MADSAFTYFLQRRNAHVVRLLETNHSVAGALQGLLEHLVEYAEERGVPYTAIELADVHVTRDNQLVARIHAKR